ncbi:hypothetical protein Tco_0834473 [Tanacetum coccineum]
MIEPDKSLKKKDQIKFYEEMAKRLAEELEAELEEEEERVTIQREEEANLILWDNTQAMIEADYELAQRLQAEEQGEWVNSFVPIDSKVVEGSGKKTKSNRKETVSKKRIGEELDEKSVKRQKLEDDAKKAELQLCLEIVSRDDEDVMADGSTKFYKIFTAMLDDFDRQDVVHVLLMDTGITIHMMVEKKYPLTQEMLSRMLSRRLEVDHECEITYELLRFTRSQLKKKKSLLLVIVSTTGEDCRKYSKSLLMLVVKLLLLIKQRIQAARDRQKSYTDLKRKPMEFQVGDRVMLKVSPWKGVVRFGKRGKLNLRYVGPFKVLEKVRAIAYKLELPQELSRVHNTFHVSNLRNLVMLDSEDSTVTYTEVSSPFEDLSDIGSPGVDGLPMMPEDPYAYVEAALQAPPSPDYVPSPEEPEQAPPSPDFIPGPIYPEFMPPEDDVLPAEEQPLPAAVSPAADSPGYITDSDPDEDDKDPEEDPADYPDDKDDNDDEEESSRDDADDKEEDKGKDEDEEEEEEHLASTNSVPPPAYHTTARMSIRDQTPIPFPSAAEVDRFLAISTLPPSPLTSYSSLLLQIPSPPLLV